VAFALLVVAALVLLRLAWAARGTRKVLAIGLALAAALAVVAALLSAPTAYTLRKTVGLLMMPLGLIWLGILVAAVIAFETHRRRLAVGMAILALVLEFAGNPVIGGWLIGRLERPFEKIDPLRRGPFEAVFVFGGGASRDQSGRISLDDAGDRIILAVRLFLAGRTERLVASGPWVEAVDGSVWSYPEMVADLWHELGVPRDRIVVLSGPTSTSDEAAAYAELLARTGWSRLGAVTSAFHMRRALENLHRHGIRAEPLPCDLRGSTRVPDLRTLVPQASGFLLSQIAVWEMLGSAAGR